MFISTTHGSGKDQRKELYTYLFNNRAMHTTFPDMLFLWQVLRRRKASWGKASRKILFQSQSLSQKYQYVQEMIPRWQSWYPIHVQDGKICECQKDPLTNSFADLSYDEGIVMWGSPIIVPKKLRKQTVKICHEGHMGITKTKKLFRSKVWFPSIDRDVQVELCEMLWKHCYCWEVLEFKCPLNCVVVLDG